MFQRLSEGDFCSASHRKLYETEQQEINAARMRDGEHWGERTHSRTLQRRLADPKARTGALAEYVPQRPTVQPRPAAQLPTMAQENPAPPPASLPTSSGLLPELLQAHGIQVPSRVRRPESGPALAGWEGAMPEQAMPDLAKTVKLALPVDLLGALEPDAPQEQFSEAHACGSAGRAAQMQAPVENFEQPPADFGLPGLSSTAVWLESRAAWAAEPAPEFSGPTAFDPVAPAVPPESESAFLKVPEPGFAAAKPADEPYPQAGSGHLELLAAQSQGWCGFSSQAGLSLPIARVAQPVGSREAEDRSPAPLMPMVASSLPEALRGRLAGVRVPSGSPTAPEVGTARAELGGIDRSPEAFPSEGLPPSTALLALDPAFRGAMIEAGRADLAHSDAIAAESVPFEPRLPRQAAQLAGLFLSSRYGKRIYRLPVPQPVNSDLRLAPGLQPYAMAVPPTLGSGRLKISSLHAPVPVWKRMAGRLGGALPGLLVGRWAEAWRSAPLELRWLAAGVPVAALLVTGFAVWSTRPIPAGSPVAAAPERLAAEEPREPFPVQTSSRPNDLAAQTASAPPGSPAVAATRPKRTAAASDAAAKEMQAARDVAARWERPKAEPLPEPDSVASSGWGGDLQMRWSRLVQRIASRAAVAYVDDFRSGLSRWAGRGDWARNWSYDQLGFIRPGGLAVYEPSLSLRDYRMEFLALVEQGGVSWAYRVMDWRNYYAGRLLVSDDSGMPVLMVEHFAVVNGRVSRVERKVLPAALRPESFYRIKVDVSGSKFAVYLQGTLIDHWSDDRLPAGGTGFFASKGDAARIRWMEVSHQYDLIGRVCASLVPEPLRGRQGG